MQVMKEQTFGDVLEEYRNIVWTEIQPYFYSEIGGVSSLTDKEIEAFHWKLSIDYPSRGGKYFRPTLLILTAEAMGQDLEAATKTAAAMEISENWLLVHDDLEDLSLSRRGKPTLHLRYSPALSVNAGDALHLIMWKILRDNEPILGHDKAFEVMDEFYRMLMRTTLGQTAEISQIQTQQFDLSENDAYYIMDGKTSYYTVAGPMRLGAILAENNRRHLDEIVFPVLNELGCYLGRAFQITDDVLDLTSDFEGLKVQSGNDIYEGKRSLVLVHLLQNVNRFDHQQVLKVLVKAREEKTPEDIRLVLTLMEEYGSIRYATGRAREYAEQAREVFNRADFLTNPSSRQKLQMAIDFIVDRTY